MHCLEHNLQVTHEHPPVNTTVIDGAVEVNMLRPTSCQAIQDNSGNVFNPYISRQHLTSLDVAWDVYDPDSLKSATRLKICKCVRRKCQVNGIHF